MRRARDQRDSFESGVLAPEFANRFDDVAKTGLSTGENVMILNSGSVQRRPGSFPTGPVGYDRVIIVEGLGLGPRTMYFKAGEVVVWAGGAAETTITGCPWGAADVDIMQIVEVIDALIIVSASFRPKTLKWNGTAWVLADLTFVDGIGGSIRQPYYRYAERGVAIQPSGLTGSITVVASDDVFAAAHVGTRIRYLGKEIRITAFTNATTVTGTVMQPLYPTFDVTVASAAGFSIGQVVEGEDTQVRGVVAGISGSVLTVLMVEGYDNFDATTPENLIGPESKSAISGSVAASSPAATLQWDEEMISAVHGYPAAVGYHDNRLLLGNFAGALNQFAAFVVGVYNDFNINDGSDAEAFIYGIGDNESARILHFVSAEQPILLTDKGHYYIGTRAEAPFTPTGVLQAGIRFIGPESATSCRPALINEGVLFASASDSQAGPRIMLCRPSGNVLRSWTSTDVSEYGYHLINNPKEIVAANGIDSRPERVIIIRNNDGTLAVATIRRGQEQPGWCRWRVMEGVVSVASRRRQLLMIASNVSDKTGLIFNFARIVDGFVAGDNASAFGYSSKTVDIVVGQHVVGRVTVNADGSIDDYDAAEIFIGQDFAVDVVPIPFIHPRDPSPRDRRGVRGFVLLENSGYIRINGYRRGDVFASDDLGGELRAYTRTEEAFLDGPTERPFMRIEQRAGEGGPLTITGVTIEAAD